MDCGKMGTGTAYMASLALLRIVLCFVSKRPETPGRGEAEYQLIALLVEVRINALAELEEFHCLQK
jgi:hypothetical protein